MILNQFDGKKKQPSLGSYDPKLGFYRNSNSRYIDIINNTLYTCNGKIFGLKFASYSYAAQATKSKLVAEQRLQALRKFSGLSQHNKLELYISIILPALTYPVVPLNSLSVPVKYKLQVAQNKALRFITNADRYTNNQTLHTICNVDPINITLHKQA